MTKAVRLNVDNKKKLVSATAMLLISALMLGISTFAWFTMSKELEVKGIQMSAATPDDVQISLGKLTSGKLLENTGTLNVTSGAVDEPGAETDCDDWANVATISKYYKFGKLFPASSTSGENLYATKDSSGIGRTLKANAEFYQVDDNEVDEDSKTFMATTYRNSETGWSAWKEGTAGDNYVSAVGYKKTNDDGYYVDIPVWFRTSNPAGVKLTVEGYVQKGTQTQDNDNDYLYQAARVAILNADGSVDGGLVELKDASDFGSDNNSIIDSNNFTTRESVTTYKALSGIGASSHGAWDILTKVTDPTTKVVDLQTTDSYHGQGNGVYGNALKKIIRIWIEGEDGNCYNPNAGQDFKIALKFK